MTRNYPSIGASPSGVLGKGPSPVHSGRVAPNARTATWQWSVAHLTQMARHPHHPPWPPTPTHMKTNPPSYTHDIIPRESPSPLLSILTVRVFFLRLVPQRRAAYASSCFARITPHPAAINDKCGSNKATTTVIHSVKDTPRMSIDHSTIFDHSLIFPSAGSLSVVTLRLM